MIALSVNVNKIATLRNARGGDRPNVVHAARTCIAAGCHGITVHPRPDGRHIRYADMHDLAALLADYDGIEFNIEGYPSPAFLDLVCEVKPAQCTLVPDPPDVLTSNAGWDLAGNVSGLGGALARLHSQRIRTSLFLDPVCKQVHRAREIGTDRIELYTERYARTFGGAEQEPVIADYRNAAREAQRLGLGVNAGHDLGLDNLPYFVAQVSGLLEVSIGHALICDALYRGLDATVRAYLAALGHNAH